MKWIKISKANIKFNTNYLVSDGDAVDLVQLEESKITSGGVHHIFHDTNNEPLPYVAQYISLVSLPSEK